MLLTIKALRDLRDYLDISQKNVAYRLHISVSVVSKWETERSKISEKYHEKYENFLFDVLNKKIFAPKRKRKIYRPFNPDDCVSKEKAAGTKIIRLFVNVSSYKAVKAIKKAPASLIAKENGKTRMLKSEYEALMSFYNSLRKEI